MARELILYVGLHKTASSSIQDTCAANQGRLRAAGFSYPTYRMDGTMLANHTRLLRNIFRRNPERLGLGGQLAGHTSVWKQHERDYVRDQFASTLQAAPGRVVLAAEGMSIYTEDELVAARDWLQGLGFRLRVICHVRHLSPWLDSMVAQRVRGQIALTIGEAVGELVAAGGLVRPRLALIRSVFPQAEIYSHEEATAHPHGPPGFFLETIGVRDTAQFRWQRSNEGGSDLAVRTLSLVNERFGRTHWDGTHEELMAFRMHAGMNAITALGGGKFALLRSEAAPLAALVAAENAWLRDEFGAAFHDPDPSFAPARRPLEAAQQEALRAAVALCEPRLRSYLLEALAPPTGIEPVSSA